jgi:tetratricopeptide (TPR) repeat protein
VQVKDNAASGALTLGSQPALDALGNFWRLRERNPRHSVSFQYVTTAKVGLERDGVRAGLAEGERGIELWTECRLTPQPELVFDRIHRLRSFLLSRDRLDAQLASFLRGARSEEIFGQLVRRFEWVPDEPGLAEVRGTVVAKLIDIGLRRGVTVRDCEAAALQLYTRIEQVAIDPTRPALTLQEFATIFDRFTQLQVPRAAFADPGALMVDKIGAPLDGTAAPALQPPASLVDRFPAPILSARRRRRESLITWVSELAARHGAVHVHGGTGMGKTTLIRQTVDGSGETIFWADFRGRAQASLAASTCVELRRAVEGATTSAAVVIDDFDIKEGDPRLIETELSRLAAAVRARGGVLYTIAHNPLPPRLAVAVGLPADGAIAVPHFDVDEVAAFVDEVAAFIVDLGCADLDRINHLARMVMLHTSGHPQLVAARVLALEAEGFPPVRASDLLEKPKDVIDERREARALIRAVLPEPARDLLYRLSVMMGIFKRSDALRIAELKPPVPRAGENLEILTGAWLERPAEGYFRVSPLAAEAGQEVLTPKELTSLHGDIAACLLAERSIGIHEFSTALMHSIVGGAEGVVSLLAHVFMKTPVEIKQALADELTWVLICGVSEGTRLPFESLAARLMFRLMQWQIAGRSGRQHLPALAAVMDGEFSDLPDETSWRLMRHLYLAHRLVQVDAPMLLAEFVSKALEFANLTAVLADDPETSSAIRIPEGHWVGRPVCTLLQWFSVFLSPQVQLPEDLAALADALDAREADQRAQFLAAFDDTELRLLFARPWLSLRGRPAQDYEAFCELLERILAAARRWRNALWCQSLARQLAITLDSNLNLRGEATEALDAVAAEWGDHVSLDDQRAVIASEHGDYAEALEIWRRTLGLWSWNNFDLLPALSTRNAAVAAMHLGYWSEAEEFFDTAEKRASYFERHAWQIGLAADAANSAWMKGHGTKIEDLSSAIGRFGSVVQRLESLRNEPEDLSGYFVHKAVTALLLWLSHGNRAGVTAQITLPSLGFCSQLDINPRVADLPPNPPAYAWLALYWLSRQVTDAAFESQSAEIAEAIRWQQHALQRMTEAQFARVRLFARIDATTRAAQHGPFEAVIDAAAEFAAERLRIQAQPSVPVHEPDPAGIKISAFGPDVVEPYILPALLAALVGARAQRAHLDDITAAWRRRAEVYGSSVVAVAERIVELIHLPYGELDGVLADGKESFERRFVAATLICGLEDSAPTSALHAHLAVFDVLAHHGLIREFASSS